MTRVFFSSWDGRIIDERGKKPQERVNLEETGLPAEIGKEKLRAFIGWSGMVIVDPGVNIVRMLAEYYSKFQHESCGRCVPCRVGSKILADKLEKMLTAGGTETDLAYLKELAVLIRDGSLCELGISSPTPLLHALDYFEDDFKEFFNRQDREGKNTDQYRTVLTAPCRNGCPAHINVPGYIEAIKEGNFAEALAINREKTPLVGTLGRVCVHPCENNCNRQPYDEALSIRLLKRFAADYGLRNSFEVKKQVVQGTVKPDRIAVIGSGPAGLNAAYQLARKGYEVTIYEALPVEGGMLAVGIPDYRLPREILDYEVKQVKNLGVEIICNMKVGQDITLEQLKAEGYGAIFIATGLHDSAAMGCSGEDSCTMGYLPGVEFLRLINLGEKVNLGDRVAVVGGGNVAMDCARSAVRMGVNEVNLIYRRSRNEMPANKEEVDAAEEEGIIFQLLANPTAVMETKGCVNGLECIRMQLGELDASGRRRPVPMDGSEFKLPVDTVIPAIGQIADLSFVDSESGLKISERGTLVVDRETMATPVPGIFAGGDVVLGARTVIEAIASANRAAEAIDSYLKNGRIAVGPQLHMEGFLEKAGVYREKNVPEMIGGRRRLQEEGRPVKERITGFDEADLGFKYPLEVMDEAERCVKCLRLGMAVL
ncbi:MAG: FAD-dependent oxidoreductase [Bacillota bacterium]|nr:FAD-dependent oxidoreductase [Bacillota bacterium]